MTLLRGLWTRRYVAIGVLVSTALLVIFIPSLGEWCLGCGSLYMPPSAAAEQALTDRIVQVARVGIIVTTLLIASLALLMTVGRLAGLYPLGEPPDE